MSNDLSERIAKNVGKDLGPGVRARKNHAVFLALKNEIAKAIKDGWPMMTIWKTLYSEKKINVGYDSFRRSVRRYILKSDDLDGIIQKGVESTATGTVKAEVKSAVEPIKAESKKEGFVFNPKPTQEDLI